MIVAPIECPFFQLSNGSKLMKQMISVSGIEPGTSGFMKSGENAIEFRNTRNHTTPFVILENPSVPNVFCITL